MQSMPDLYPMPLGARKTRLEHNQYLIGIPKKLVAHWAIGTQTVLFWTLNEDHTVTLTKLEPMIPGRPLPHDDPRSQLSDVITDLD